MMDTNPHSISANGWLENVNLVKKYEISEEDYNKRRGVYIPLTCIFCFFIAQH